MNNRLKKITKIVKEKLENLGPLHDFDHVMRVYNLCLQLAKYYKGVDLEILQAAALLHDIARPEEDHDSSGKIDHTILGPKIAEGILRKLGYAQAQIEEIKHCIATHRYRKNQKPQTIEAKILHDADKLDACGAIGLLRGAAYWVGMHKGKFYRNVPIKQYIQENLEEGKITGRIKDKSRHALNIEIEIKQKHLPEQLYTAKARAIAKGRVAFMRQFMRRLRKEIKGRL